MECKRNPERVCDCHGDYCPPAAPPPGEPYPFVTPFRVTTYLGHIGTVIKRTGLTKVSVQFDHGNTSDTEASELDISELSEATTGYKVTPQWLDFCHLCWSPSAADMLVPHPGRDSEGNQIGCGECDNCTFGCLCLYSMWGYIRDEVEYGQYCRREGIEPEYRGRSREYLGGSCVYCHRSTKTHLTIPEAVVKGVRIWEGDLCTICRLTRELRGTVLEKTEQEPEPEFSGKITSTKDYAVKSLWSVLSKFGLRV